MELNNINEKLENINIDKPTKEAILQLIDLKTNSDMDKVLNKMDGFNNRMESINDRMNTINHRMENTISTFTNEMKHSSDSLKNKIEHTNDSLKAEMKGFNKEIQTLYKVIIGAATLITILLTIIALKK